MAIQVEQMLMPVDIAGSNDYKTFAADAHITLDQIAAGFSCAVSAFFPA